MRKLLDYADLATLDTMRVEAITTVTAKRPVVTLHDPLIERALLRRLMMRAKAYAMTPQDYLDMVASEDYMAWLRWQTRQGSEGRNG